MCRWYGADASRRKAPRRSGPGGRFCAPALDLSGDDFVARLGADARDIALLVPDPAPVEDTRETSRLAPPPGGEERFRLFEAVARVLGATAGPSGLVVVLDDLHWADPSSALLLAHMGRGLASSRVLVVATYRDKGTAP